MSTSALATICAGLIGLGVIAYAVLGGADYGGGVWDLLASGPLADRQRASIAHAIGPVWEANNVWLIYVITVTWTAFPVVYASVSTALFVPIVLVLMGIILRGAAFGFRSQYAAHAGIAVAWGHIFNSASTITPFLLGTVAGAIAGGALHIRDGAVSANYWVIWTTPFALTCGAFALSLCTVLAATYLAVEAQAAGDLAMVDAFRAKALVSGAVTAAVGALAAVLAHSQSPVLWHGLIGRALPLSLGAVLIGLVTAASLLLGYYRAARLGVAAETACILAAWGVAQYPYLIIPDVTISNAAVPKSVLLAVVIASGAGMLILLPSLWFLFHVFKGHTGVAIGRTAAERADEGLRIAFADVGVLKSSGSAVSTVQDTAPQSGSTAPASGAGDADPSATATDGGLTGTTTAPSSHGARRMPRVVMLVATFVLSELLPLVWEQWMVRQARRRLHRNGDHHD